MESLDKELTPTLCPCCGQPVDPAKLRETPNSARPVLLTMDEVAELLRVHKNTVANYIKDGRLAAVKMREGRTVLIDQRNALALLEPVKAGKDKTT